METEAEREENRDRQKEGVEIETKSPIQQLADLMVREIKREKVSQRTHSDCGKAHIVSTAMGLDLGYQEKD